jgi:1-acyl-sn-glycerol-3-phosphate acyltransferase
MILLRSLLFYLYLGLVTTVISFTLLVTGPFISFRSRHVLARTWAQLVTGGLGFICGLRYQVEGLENLPKEGNAVVLANHQSAWETIALRALFPPEQNWVLKRELFLIPIFGWGLAMLKPIAIDRGKASQALRKVLKEGIASLKAGSWMVVFPEGTRVAPGERGRWGASGAILAKKSNRPVIPLAHNAGLYWRRNALRKYPGTIQVVIGEAIDPANKETQEIMDEVEAWITGQLANMINTAESMPKS